MRMLFWTFLEHSIIEPSKSNKNDTYVRFKFFDQRRIDHFRISIKTFDIKYFNVKLLNANQAQISFIIAEPLEKINEYKRLAIAAKREWHVSFYNGPRYLIERHNYSFIDVITFDPTTNELKIVPHKIKEEKVERKKYVKTKEEWAEIADKLIDPKSYSFLINLIEEMK